MKRLFNYGDTIEHRVTKELGLILSPSDLKSVSKKLKHKKRVGSYFSPGCITKPDYITYVPVIFEDHTYDILRAQYIKKHDTCPDFLKEILKMLKKF